MFLFLRLLLAHLIGDFPLQFNTIYAWKLQGLKKAVPHALIVWLCFVAFSWPYLARPEMWLFIVFLGATHLVQDRLKIRLGNRFSFFAYIADQLSHVGLIACLFLTDLKDLVPPDPRGNPLVALYCDNRLALYCIALVAATYNGYFTIRCFKDAYLERAKYNGCEKWFGMLERGLIVTLCFAPSHFFFLLPAVALVRPLGGFYAGKRCGLADDFSSVREAGMSWLVALATGACALYFMPRTL